QPGPQPRGFQFGAPPRPATPVAEGSATFWAGAALLVAGMPAYWGLHQWIEAPPFVPIDRPFTLNREYLHTGPFRISLSGGYSFYVDFDSSRSYPGCSYDTLYNRQWELTRLGLFGRHRQVLWGYDARGLELASGTYDLNLSVSGNTDCFNAIHPRLRVDVIGTPFVYDAATLVVWPVAGLPLAGLILLTTAAIRQVRRPPPLVAPAVTSIIMRGQLP